MEEITQAATQATGIITTRIPGPKALEVEVEFTGREAGMVRAKWLGGSLAVPAEILHRVQTVVLGSRSAAQDGRAVCQLHGFHGTYSWGECQECQDEKRALVEQKATKLLTPEASPAPADDIVF